MLNACAALAGVLSPALQYNLTASRALLAAASLQTETCLSDRYIHCSSEQASNSEIKVDGQGSQTNMPYKGQRPWKSVRPRDFYHYRRKDLDRRDVTRAKQVAAKEAGTHEPWLVRNVPLKPPASVAVINSSASMGARTPDKTFTFGADELAKSASTKALSVTKQLDVLNMKVGYSLDAQYAVPDQVKAFVLDQTTMCLFGTDKNQVSQIAAKIRQIKPPEPYKGAGIRVVGESIKLKEKKGKK